MNFWHIQYVQLATKNLEAAAERAEAERGKLPADIKEKRKTFKQIKAVARGRSLDKHVGSSQSRNSFAHSSSYVFRSIVTRKSISRWILTMLNNNKLTSTPRSSTRSLPFVSLFFFVSFSHRDYRCE